MIQQSQLTPTSVVIAMYEYYRAGNSLNATARKFGKSPNGVRKPFQRHGFHIRNKAHAMRLLHNVAEETRAMYADYQAGMSHRQIAKKYHYSPSAIGQRFKSYGYKSRLGKKVA
jgi:uncharacterized protein YjcR